MCKVLYLMVVMQGECASVMTNHPQHGHVITPV